MIYGQTPVLLDMCHVAYILAAFIRGCPCTILSGFGLVQGAGDGSQGLRPCGVVGESLALVSRPLIRARIPGFLQSHGVIDLKECWVIGDLVIPKGQPSSICTLLLGQNLVSGDGAVAKSLSLIAISHFSSIGELSDELAQLAQATAIIPITELPAGAVRSIRCFR